MTDKREFRRAAVVGRGSDPRVAEPMRALTGYLTAAGVSVFITDDNPLDLDAERVAVDQIAECADLVVAIGGDGTLLSAAGYAVVHDKPLLGINRGRLGFLTDVRPADMQTSLGAILAGDFTESRRALLEATINGQSVDRRTGYALNDIVVSRREPGRMLDFRTYVNGAFVNEHSGDGLIAATPTGSTAYALSCAGPIIQPGLDAIALVPICPHTLSDRPIVIPGSAEIRVEILGPDGMPGEVTCDGQPIGELGGSDELRIATAQKRITLIHPPGYDYYELLRSKLNWGDSRRNRRHAPR